jgi:ABC-type amino acid transport substrate-binding protein
MGASTKNYQREKQVDFSLVYSASETTFLVNKTTGIKSTQDLNNQRISVGKGTTNLSLLAHQRASGAMKPAKILSYQTHDQAFRALITGKADAYCADRILLATKRLQAPDPDSWVMLEDAIGYEPYAFMIAENNSDFLDFVNDTIRWTLLTGDYFEIYQKWMGPLSMGPFKMSPSFKEYLNVITYPIPENWWK